MENVNIKYAVSMFLFEEGTILRKKDKSWKNLWGLIGDPYKKEDTIRALAHERVARNELRPSRDRMSYSGAFTPPGGKITKKEVREYFGLEEVTDEKLEEIFQNTQSLTRFALCELETEIAPIDVDAIKRGLGEQSSLYKRIEKEIKEIGGAGEKVKLPVVLDSFVVVDTTAGYDTEKHGDRMYKKLKILGAHVKPGTGMDVRQINQNVKKRKMLTERLCELTVGDLSYQEREELKETLLDVKAPVLTENEKNRMGVEGTYSSSVNKKAGEILDRLGANMYDALIEKGCGTVKDYIEKVGEEIFWDQLKDRSALYAFTEDVRKAITPEASYFASMRMPAVMNKLIRNARRVDESEAGLPVRSYEAAGRLRDAVQYAISNGKKLVEGIKEYCKRTDQKSRGPDIRDAI